MRSRETTGLRTASNIFSTARAALLRVGSLCAIGAVLGGCDVLDEALNVEAPHVIDARDMDDPQNARLLVTGAIADFECALGAYIVNSGLLGNELRDASVTSARFSLDQRTIDESSPYGTNSCTGNPPGIYVPISTAIWTSNNALEKLKSWTDEQVPNRTELIAYAAAYSGYSHILMGEGFCSAVIEENGPEVTPQQVFEVAVERFTEAIAAAQAVNNQDILNLARLGRARARLNLEDFAGAAADARAVLASDPRYTKVATTSTASSRRWNRVGDEFFGGRITVDSSYFGLTVDGVPDPRVRVINTGENGHDNFTPVHIVAKYGESLSPALREVPVPIATWREAHLIIAEAEGGQEAVDQINVLRNYWGLPEFAGGTDEEIRAQVIEERKRELYLEGHHLNDLRRFDIPNTPPPGAPYRQGGLYGSARCFPLPAVERNNNPSLR
ncbi:MAG TPA: RagB/SusD family nutrient uptake outer membrane protein [Longimicrobiales bacterium]